MLVLALISSLLLQAPPAPASPSAPTRAKDASVEKDDKGDKASDKDKGEKDKGEKDKKDAEEKPVTTKHELKLPGRLLRYSVTTGLMPLKNEQGEKEADIFFMAYTAERSGGPEKRPLMFSFNGGPGSSSVWLHLGALGPRRVKMLDDGGMPAPPYQLVDNEHTWLDQTDLVFIDPVGTGYSRATKPELGKKFWGLQGDIESVGEFIRLYLTRYERWGSPLFLVGESYGTTRAAGLSGHLVDQGIAFNGILLVSSILNFQTARFTKGNDSPYPLFLPTYSATAWYHKRLPADLQAKPVKAVLEEVRAFAGGEYTLALAKGDRLSAAERAATLDKLARYTGLGKTWLDETDLRVEIQQFCKELLRSEKRTVGRLDSRFKGIDHDAAGERPDFDPSMAAIRPPYTATLNDYVRRELGYKSDLHYYILGGGIGAPWDFGRAGAGFADTSEALRSAFSKNPSMRVFVASGYYDLATPFFATEYTLSHMGLEASQRARVFTHEYEAGHMMYIHVGELGRLKKDMAAFVEAALKP
ncbi:MAG TPA: peptidase S10 [Vicinamibacteria bacterium]